MGTFTPPQVSSDKAVLPQVGNPRPIASEQLLQGHSEVRIAHGGSQYILRLTRLGKLILTK